MNRERSLIPIFVFALCVSTTGLGRVLYQSGSPNDIDIKYREAFFLGSCEILACSPEVGQEYTPSFTNSVTLTLRVVESLKGPAPGSVIDVLVLPESVALLPAKGRVVYVGIMGENPHVLWEVYAEENWQLVKERIAEAKQKRTRSAKIVPAQSLLEEHQQLRNKWLEAGVLYHVKKVISREEYDAVEREYYEWLKAHPEVRDYVLEEIW